MNITSIDLNNEDDVSRDESGITVAYFSMKAPVLIDNQLIEDLKKKSMVEGIDLRLCLHNDSGSEFHNMIIVQHKAGYFPPHRHPLKAECYHIIQGELGAVHFDDFGNIIHICKLSASKNFIHRIQCNAYHVVFPLSDITIYHESKSGPFVRKQDFILPEWAPNFNEKQAIKEYKDMLVSCFEEQKE